MKKKALIALTSAFSVFLIGTIGLSLAWFTTAKIVDTSGLNGSVLRSYFDIKEGKNELVICIGCTGGRHRGCRGH